MKPRMDNWVPGGMLIMIVIIMVATLSLYLHPERQRDFNAAYAAAKALRQGLQPYDITVTAPLMRATPAPYVYPPYTLYLYRPFTWFDFAMAARIYLTLKLIALGGLLYLWHRLIDLNQYRGLLWALVPLAFSGTLLADLRAGNISVFEQLFIWMGFYCYTRGRLVGFGVAIILAALFKFTPILLLGLLAARWRKKELALGAGFGAGFIALIGISAAVWSNLFASFLKSVHGLGGEHGENNPSSWALVSDLANWLQLKTRCPIPVAVPLGIYAVMAVAVLAVSVAMFWRLRSLEAKRTDLWRICLVCFVYALVLPRFKDYSYILLIAPAFFVLCSSKWLNPLLPFSGLLIIYSYRDFQYLGTALEPFYQIFGTYYCLLLASALFALCCCSIWRESNQNHGRGRQEAG